MKLSNNDYITKTIKEREDARQAIPFKGYNIKTGWKINHNLNAEDLNLPKEHQKYMSALDDKINAIKHIPVKGKDAAMRKKIILNTFLYKKEIAEKNNVIDFSIIDQS